MTITAFGSPIFQSFANKHAENMSNSSLHLNADELNESKVAAEDVPTNVAGGRGSDGGGEDDGSMECHPVAQDGDAQGQDNGGEPRCIPEHAGGGADAAAPAQPADEDDEHDVRDAEARHQRSGEELDGADDDDDGASSDGLEGVTDELAQLDLDGPGNLSKEDFDHLGRNPKARLTTSEEGLEGYRLIGHIVARCVRFCSSIKSIQERKEAEMGSLWEAVYDFREEFKECKGALEDLEKHSADNYDGIDALLHRVERHADNCRNNRAVQQIRSELGTLKKSIKTDSTSKAIADLGSRIEAVEQRLQNIQEGSRQRAAAHDHAAGIAMVFTRPDGTEHVELLHYDEDGKLPAHMDIEAEARRRNSRRRAGWKGNKE